MEEEGTNGHVHANRSSDHSAALAEKLLQGWALLQEHCPHCLTPLVRNRQRKMYCVACAQWVVSQAEAAEQLAQERGEKGSGIEATAHPVPLPEPASVGLKSSPPADGSTKAPQNLDQAVDVAQCSNTRDSCSVLRVPKLHYCPKTLKQVLPNVASILIHKLEEIGSALLLSQDVHDIKTYTTALRECLQALQDVKACEDCE